VAVLAHRLLYEELQRGPTDEEKALGFTTEVPTSGEGNNEICAFASRRP